MTEQELRDEFENEVRSHHILIKKKDFQHIYIDEKVNTKWIYFEKGYSLAQETIAEIESRLEQSVDIGVVNQLNETIKAKDAEILKAREIVNGFWAWFHIKSTRTAPNEFLEKAKAWLEDNK